MTSIQPKIHVNEPVTVVGLHIRTTGSESATSIPSLWHEVESGAISVPGKISDDLYAVYANLENAGVSNAGHFSLIIGYAVAPGSAVPTGLTLVTIPRSHRASFSVPENDPRRVVEAWQNAWAFDDHQKTFICEYELYRADGEATVNVGVWEPGRDNEFN